MVNVKLLRAKENGIGRAFLEKQRHQGLLCRVKAEPESPGFEDAGALRLNLLTGESSTVNLPLTFLHSFKARRSRLRLSDEEIKHVEKLARIRLDDEAREKLRGQLSRIIDFVQKLQNTDTAGFERGGEASKEDAFLRGKKAGDELDREHVLGEAPKRKDGYFTVPPVIDRE